MLEEIRALWSATQTSPAPAGTSRALLDLIFQTGAVPTYDRLQSPFLRSAQISRPKISR